MKSNKFLELKTTGYIILKLFGMATLQTQGECIHFEAYRKSNIVTILLFNLFF